MRLFLLGVVDVVVVVEPPEPLLDRALAPMPTAERRTEASLMILKQPFVASGVAVVVFVGDEEDEEDEDDEDKDEDGGDGAESCCCCCSGSLLLQLFDGKRSDDFGMDSGSGAGLVAAFVVVIFTSTSVMLSRDRNSPKASEFMVQQMVTDIYY